MTTKEKLVTYDDYRKLPDDGKRYEIIRGELLMTPAPSTNHQRVLGKLFISLNNYVEENNLGEVLVAPVDIIFSMTDVVQPDLIFVSREREEIITKKNIVDAPDLVVEIISEHTEAIDRNRKKALYERYKVREYWIVDPEERQIMQYVFEEGAFKLQANTRTEDAGKIISAAVTDFTLRLKDVFKN
ncbi:Endonuclease, Uma2 family (restriction endonuclease fold) [Fodinibius roseus]|uniref:Endonuclease, Uma2 family (Restriction endonuclease fold) n=1 Tax=Fodinibius roseus TaxID=1194090 RepID=A0A1M4WFE5_9BACT|nr:Uma2 family endonuclease [Fodinibius roseus]SHE79793.1 Endonuclease, Uma2 family (restriction endonuclease fold) [Fodinibius roseus]